MHGSWRGFCNHLQCGVAVFTVMFFVSEIVVVLMLLDCADPVALRTYCYLRFNIVILKRRVQESCKRWSYLNVLLKSVSLVCAVLCGDVRCGFLFL